MRSLLLVVVLALAGCVSTEWPEAGKHPSGYCAVSLADLSALHPGDTAGDVMKKMGRPADELPVPWFTYLAADHEGKFYLFRFTQRKKKLISPSDRLVSVELVGRGDEFAPVVVWPPKT